MSDSCIPEFESTQCDGGFENSVPDDSGTTHSRSASWFDSLKRYVQETDVSNLNLSGMKLTAILEFLADSQITELDLSHNKLKFKMGPLSRLLIQTKIKKLNVSSCNLKAEDIQSLMKALKETQITDLDISANHSSVYKHCREFVSYLVESHLTVLNVASCSVFSNDEEALLFIQALRNTSLTRLNLTHAFRPSKRVRVCSDTLISLFFELKHTSITHLNLAYCNICDGSGLERLGDSLRDSKLVELDLRNNYIADSEVDALFQALVGSKVTSLYLMGNCFRGDNSLGLFLRETQITHLDLKGNYRIRHAKMFSFPDFLRGSLLESLELRACLLPDSIGVPLMRSLRFSKLKHLDVRRNMMTSVSLGALVEVVKDTSITNFKFSYFDPYRKRDEGDVDVDQKLLLIGELSVRSKLQQLEVHELRDLKNRPLVIAAFVEKLADSPVTSLSMTRFEFGKIGVEVLSPILAKTHLNHLNICGNSIEDGVLSLAANLKFTTITHLNLSWNDISDEGVKALAECLKETRIVDLDLSENKITCRGATALAASLKDAHLSILNLNGNQIGNEGLKALAEHVKSSLITSLEVSRNPGNKSVVETAIWSNRRLLHQKTY